MTTLNKKVYSYLHFTRKQKASSRSGSSILIIISAAAATCWSTNWTGQQLITGGKQSNNPAGIYGIIWRSSSDGVARTYLLCWSFHFLLYIYKESTERVLPAAILRHIYGTLEHTRPVQRRPAGVSAPVRLYRHPLLRPAGRPKSRTDSPPWAIPPKTAIKQRGVILISKLGR
jgi:hypothetical protein